MALTMEQATQLQTYYSAQEFSRVISMEKNGPSVCVCGGGCYIWVHEAFGVEKDYRMCAMCFNDGKLHQEKATVSH